MIVAFPPPLTWPTVMVCEQLERLPQRSVAVQVRTRTEVLGQLPAVAVSANVTEGCGSQVSVAVTAGGLGTAPCATVMFCGQPISVGGCVSRTVMFWVQV